MRPNTEGQTPTIAKCQGLLYHQLTGNVIPQDSSADENEQLIKGAFDGKSVLLVLDDCWEVAHAAALNFIDERTNSKVLISSRVRETLEGGDVTQIGLPTDDEALHMLYAAAGVEDPAAVAPEEAMQVIRYCNKLPLVRCSFFARKLPSRMLLVFTPARLKLLLACEHCHSSRLFILLTGWLLTGWHCKLRPNTEGFGHCRAVGQRDVSWERLARGCCSAPGRVRAR